MKRYFIPAVLSLGLALFSCSAKAQDTNDENGETVKTEAPFEVKTESHSAEYKLENNKIIPVNGLPMVVDFSAVWCPPCKQLKPIFHRLGEENKGKIDFVTIDVDEMQAVAAAYGVQNIPTLIYLSPDGNELGRSVGFESEEDFVNNLNRYFK